MQSVLPTVARANDVALTNRPPMSPNRHRPKVCARSPTQTGNANDAQIHNHNQALLIGALRCAAVRRAVFALAPTSDSGQVQARLDGGYG
jgi:hypothetical protein